MKNIPMDEQLQKEIVARLMPLRPYKLILFGSYAYGEPDEESDIDLLFINNEETYKSFSERIDIKMQIAKRLDEIGLPIDVLAYTKKEWEDLQESGHSFVREINAKGVLLETAA
ncbi:MAG: nucleotidyltransferase domain-containing protein [Sulfuricurvum sp.]|uniref:nucleotidyltransferase domain-containing protein n=1 Tax=Sulfuricurvum sp. TaxID=2025608 RepID=UPI0025E97E41|nr:nucleotidyltransferase domain-containing protein [Sulfuricurvum sp.]MCK9371767.1 nucleotidyltransferase domain-containing protein [Sulfuricurvum sp.]